MNVGSVYAAFALPFADERGGEEFAFQRDRSLLQVSVTALV